MTVALSLAEASHQVHHAWVFVVGLTGIVGFYLLELCHMLGADEGRFVADRASRCARVRA